MKHKKICVVVGVLLMLLLLGTSAARYVAEIEKVADSPEAVAPTLQEVLTEKVVPDAALLVTEIGTLLVLLWPSIVAMTEKVGAAATRFGDATRHVQSVGDDGLAVKLSAEEAQKASEGAKETAVEAKNAAEEAKKAAEEAKEASQKMLDETSHIGQALALLANVVGLLACGNEQMVRNGSAAKVMEALKEYEK